MKLNLQLTNQTKILLGLLVVALIAAVATQWGPGLYGLISNPEMIAKRKTLQTSKDLVAASQILKPIETGLYQKTGLSDGKEPTTIFDGNFPETVVREKINAIVKKAGIPQNYQLNMKPVPGKKSERISPQAYRNLGVFSYQNKLEAEKDALNAEMEAEIQAQSDAEIAAEEDALDMLMNAWLEETDLESEKPQEQDNPEQEYTESEKTQEKENPGEKENNESEKDHNSENTDDQKQNDSEKIDDAEKGQEEKSTEQPQEPSEKKPDSDNPEDDSTEWNFSSLPDSLPIPIRIELIELIMAMAEQHLVGAEKTLFENQFFKIQTEGTIGIFGIGAKEPKTEISFRPDSQILAKFTNLIDTYGEDLNKPQLTRDMLEYLERIQAQIDELTEKIKLAPTAYSPESYTVKIKFKAEIDKLVNLNRLIETTSKWLMVRDLQISADNKQNKINVDVLMIARVYQ